jgi:hypothetical protein
MEMKKDGILVGSYNNPILEMSRRILLNENDENNLLIVNGDEMESENENIQTIDELSIPGEVDEWTPSPEPQNSVKRWKREKKYF